MHCVNNTVNYYCSYAYIIIYFPSIQVQKLRVGKERMGSMVDFPSFGHFGDYLRVSFSYFDCDCNLIVTEHMVLRVTFYWKTCKMSGILQLSGKCQGIGLLAGNYLENVTVKS